MLHHATGISLFLQLLLSLPAAPGTLVPLWSFSFPPHQPESSLQVGMMADLGSTQLALLSGQTDIWMHMGKGDITGPGVPALHGSASLLSRARPDTLLLRV